MKKYAGFDAVNDPITAGGAWVEKHGRGGECWNFLPDAGRCYGYVMTRHASGVDLKRVAAKQGHWRNNDELSGVDIVFVAKEGAMGQVVVGWYKNATLFHRKYRMRPSPTGTKPHRKIHYLCEVAEADKFLLPVESRSERVPFAPRDGYGPGQSNVWYGDGADARTRALVQRLRRYIGSAVGPQVRVVGSNRRGGGRVPPDKQTLLAIEWAAMDAVEAHFLADYEIDKTVHKDCCGWDITATHRLTKVVLQLEVKGHAGDVIQFDLTPNEYEKMQALHKTYRVCVLRNALRNKKVEVYFPKRTIDGRWQLRNSDSGGLVDLTPKIAAHASELK